MAMISINQDALALLFKCPTSKPKDNNNNNGHYNSLFEHFKGERERDFWAQRHEKMIIIIIISIPP